MSATLSNLTKKNQEFIYQAKKELVEKGKSNEEIQQILEEIVPTLLEQQKKGVTARSLYGSPAAWVEAILHPAPKVKIENSHPALMWMDSSLLIFGLIAGMTGLTALLSKQASTEQGVTILVLNSLTGGLAFYLIYYFVHRRYEIDNNKGVSLLDTAGVMGCILLSWILLMSLTSLIPRSLNPELPTLALLCLGGGVLALRFYLKKQFNIKSSFAQKRKQGSL